MRPMVEFCINRLTPDVEKIKNKLENDPEVDVLESPCLGNCEICAKTPYAMVDGEIVTGEDGPDLLKNIRKSIEERKKKMEDLLDLL
ncbi:uncharacterized protein YuzB (UPF0349 family) [Melghirimyces profundicolus]|uniref:Uncharacterized protein YuzB (UPF0349 family) n=1 Tax=Melghirimyces profundicolus TaxID=1242148 RepID=A0A2T6BST8_9BACL|nr:DUF1450 domain-containing protein [Melghirimyces profundicolus]PTX59132.1 uncharacterized protein YuzB (UPF0349 family) [Melghirimyces profundicolus]